MDGTKVVTANFEKKQYHLTINASPPEGGTVTAAGGGGRYFDCGTIVVLRAFPANDCWEFVSWTGDVTNPYEEVTYTTIVQDLSVTANFAKKQYTLTVSADPAEGGIVTGNNTYDCGTNVQITANPIDSCWEFVNWTGDVANPDSATTTVFMDENKTVVAHFASSEYILTVDANPAGSGLVMGGGPYDCGSTVPIEAAPANDCWYFVDWSGDVADPNSNATTVLIDSHKTVTANFAKYEYTLTVSADPVEGGIISGSGMYECGTDIQVEAVPSEGCWYFVYWTGDVADPYSATTTVHIDSDKSVTAHFTEVPCDLTVDVNPVE
jgi:hypothetical protein